MPQLYDELLFEIDHVIAKQHDGRTMLSAFTWSRGRLALGNEVGERSDAAWEPLPVRIPPEILRLDAASNPDWAQRKVRQDHVADSCCSYRVCHPHVDRLFRAKA
jgi:hypothetical protein